jgi:hypothetical protein
MVTRFAKRARAAMETIRACHVLKRLTGDGVANKRRRQRAYYTWFSAAADE